MAEQVQSKIHPKSDKSVLSPLRGSEMGDALLAGVSLRYTPACALATPSGFVFSPATYYRTGINPEGVERPQAGVECNGTPAFRRTVSSRTPKG